GQPRLVFRTTFSSSETAKAIGRVVPDVLEPQLRATSLPAGARMRVALVRGPSRGGATFDTLLFKALRFNGKSALENGSDYRHFVVDDPAAAPSVVDAVTAFEPHVIVLLAVPSAAVIEPLERRWRAGRARPRYVFMSSIPNDVLAWIGDSPERR